MEENNEYEVHENMESQGEVTLENTNIKIKYKSSKVYDFFLQNPQVALHVHMSVCLECHSLGF